MARNHGFAIRVVSPFMMISTRPLSKKNLCIEARRLNVINFAIDYDRSLRRNAIRIHSFASWSLQPTKAKPQTFHT